MVTVFKSLIIRKIGASEGIRTLDNHLGKVIRAFGPTGTHLYSYGQIVRSEPFLSQFRWSHLDSFALIFSHEYRRQLEGKHV